jgi:hypothetical protein
MFRIYCLLALLCLGLNNLLAQHSVFDQHVYYDSKNQLSDWSMGVYQALKEAKTMNLATFRKELQKFHLSGNTVQHQQAKALDTLLNSQNNILWDKHGRVLWHSNWPKNLRKFMRTQEPQVQLLLYACLYRSAQKDGKRIWRLGILYEKTALNFNNYLIWSDAEDAYFLDLVKVQYLPIGSLNLSAVEQVLRPSWQDSIQKLSKELGTWSDEPFLHAKLNLRYEQMAKDLINGWSDQLERDLSLVPMEVKDFMNLDLGGVGGYYGLGLRFFRDYLGRFPGGRSEHDFYLFAAASNDWPIAGLLELLPNKDWLRKMGGDSSSLKELAPLLGWQPVELYWVYYQAPNPFFEQLNKRFERLSASDWRQHGRAICHVFQKLGSWQVEELFGAVWRRSASDAELRLAWLNFVYIYWGALNIGNLLEENPPYTRYLLDSWQMTGVQYSEDWNYDELFKILLSYNQYLYNPAEEFRERRNSEESYVREDRRCVAAMSEFLRGHYRDSFLILCQRILSQLDSSRGGGWLQVNHLRLKRANIYCGFSIQQLLPAWEQDSLEQRLAKHWCEVPALNQLAYYHALAVGDYAKVAQSRHEQLAWRLNRRRVGVFMPDKIPPTGRWPYLLEYQNADTVEVLIYRQAAENAYPTNWPERDTALEARLRALGYVYEEEADKCYDDKPKPNTQSLDVLIHREYHVVDSLADYVAHRSQLILPELSQVGNYRMQLRNGKNEVDEKIFEVRAFYPLLSPRWDSTAVRLVWDLWILDARTGKPATGVRVRYFVADTAKSFERWDSLSAWKYGYDSTSNRYEYNEVKQAVLNRYYPLRYKLVEKRSDERGYVALETESAYWALEEGGQRFLSIDHRGTKLKGKILDNIGYFQNHYFWLESDARGNWERQFLYPYVELPKAEERENPISMFTDRPLYRPGHTVQLKGILPQERGNWKAFIQEEYWAQFQPAQLAEMLNNWYFAQENAEEQQRLLQRYKPLFSKQDQDVVEGRLYEWIGYAIEQMQFIEGRLKDPQGRVIMNKRMGLRYYWESFSDSLVLPTNALPGVYTWEVESKSEHGLHSRGSVCFRVEAYKRPSFVLELDSLPSPLVAFRPLRLEGQVKALAGYPIVGAEVRAKAEAKLYFPNDPDAEWTEEELHWLAYDLRLPTATTDSLGRFSLMFEDRRHSLHRPDARYHYDLSFEATDPQTGELRSTTLSFYWSDQSLNIDLDLNPQLIKQTIKPLDILVKDGLDRKLSAEIWVKILRLSPAEDAVLPSLAWPAQTHTILPDSLFRRLCPQAAYRKSIPSRVESVVLEQYFEREQLARLSLAKLPQGHYRLQISAKRDSAVGIWEQDISILDMQSRQALEGRRLWLEVENTNPQDSLILWGSSALAQPAYLHLRLEQNGLIRHDTLLLLQQRGRWALPLKNWLNQGSFYCHVLCLNENHEEIWSKSLVYQSATSTKWSIIPQQFQNKISPSEWIEWTFKLVDEKGQAVKDAETLCVLYDQSLESFEPMSQWLLQAYPSPTEAKQAFRQKISSEGSSGTREILYIQTDYIVTFDPETYNEGNNSIKTEVYAHKEKLQAPKGQSKPLGLRTDLAETVFFRPHIYTDDKGLIRLYFKNKDLLGRLRLRLLAHRANWQSSQWTDLVVSQKKLMIQPLLPRFIRLGDTLYFSAKATNLGSKTERVEAELSFFAGDKPLSLSLDQQASKQKFRLKPGLSKTLFWRISAAELPATPLQYRVMLRSKTAQDGEQGPIPVWDNHLAHWDSYPIILDCNQALDSSLEQLFPHSPYPIRQYRLQVQGNLALFLLQSLRYNLEYPYECSEQILNRVFANAVASYALSQDSSLISSFVQWAKNSHLDSSYYLPLLQPTSLLNLQKEQLKKLLDRLHSDGGLAWYPKGGSSLYISQYAIQNLIQLQKLIPGPLPQELTALYASCRQYLKQHYQTRFEEWKNLRAKPDYAYPLDPLDFHFLYLCGQDSLLAQTPYLSFMDSLMPQQWPRFRQTPALLGCLAISWQQRGQETMLQALLDSIQTWAIRDSSQQQLHWNKENPYRYYWYQQEIETQVIFLELFQQLSQMRHWLPWMENWLLAQRKNGYWFSTKANTSSLYALRHFFQQKAGQQNPILRFQNQEENPDLSTGIERTWPATDGKAPFYLLNRSQDQFLRGSVERQSWEPLWGLSAKKQADFKLQRRFYRQLPNDSLVATDTFFLGDKILLSIDLEITKEQEFTHLKDFYPAGLEPLYLPSGYVSVRKSSFYRHLSDGQINYFAARLAPGHYHFEYQLFAQHLGRFQAGYAEWEPMYAPQHQVRSQGHWIWIVDKKQ